MQFEALGDICEFLDHRRKPVSEELRKPGPIPYYGANGQQGWIDSFIFDEPLVLLAEDGGHFGSKTNPIAYKVTGKTWVNNHAHVLRPLPGCDIDYLTYALCLLDVTKLVNGSTRPKLTKSGAESIRIPYPDLAEQKRIATMLERADRLRRLRRYALDTTEAIVAPVFTTFFGSMQSGSGDAVELADVADILTGYPFPSEEYALSGEMRLCRGANVLPDRIDWSDLARWPRSKTEGLDRFILQPGDVVMAMDRPWISEGFKVARIRRNDCPALLVQRVARLRGKNGIPNEFLYHLVRQPAFTRHCRPTETTVPHISPTDIETFSFHLPSLQRQREFTTMVAWHDSLAATQRESLRQAEHLFQTLLHRAFTGGI